MTEEKEDKKKYKIRIKDILPLDTVLPSNPQKDIVINKKYKTPGAYMRKKKNEKEI